MKYYKIAVLLLALGCRDAMAAKCPAELKGASRARLESAAASVASAPLDPDSLRFCVVWDVGVAHIATVTSLQADGWETWTGMNCFGEHSGRGVWRCGPKEFRGVRVAPSLDARSELITLA